MHFTPCLLPEVYLVGLEPRGDDRGFFARAFCAREFGAHGLETAYVQANLALNRNAGLIRGMHFQRHPHSEVKLVRCVVGSIFDVVVDLRPDSPTFLRWYGAELSQQNGLMMHVPRGCAHGYQSLEAGSMVHYLVSEFYTPNSENGVRYDDPSLRIRWPHTVADVSPKDLSWPLIKDRKDL